MKGLIIITLILLSACGSKASTHSGGGSSAIPLPDKVNRALAIAAPYYDVYRVPIVMGEVMQGACAQYQAGLITISQNCLDHITVKYTACMIVHEHAHHDGANEAQAEVLHNECMVKVMADDNDNYWQNVA